MSRLSMPRSSRSGSLRRVLLAIVVALAGVVLVAGAFFLWLRRSLPELSGDEPVSGLAAPLEIVRDAHAVPHVYARSEEDAYFGLGYVHAQDRLWQMELARRLGSGTLAEVFGERALRSDRLFRTLGLRSVAGSHLAHLDAETQRLTQAYARGVNAWLERGQQLPPEFVLFGVEPAAWTAADSRLILEVMAWRLARNWEREAWRVRMSAALTPQSVSDLSPPYPGEDPIPLAAFWQRYADLGLQLRVGAQGSLGASEIANSIGSNSWAVDGTRTTSGKPLLANDPHLELSAPSAWYLAHASAPDLEVIGASLPGLPGIILGRNARVAWSFTNAVSDTQDTYLERLTPGGDGYLTPDGARDFERGRELIRVRGGADAALDVRRTRHGPVISDVSEVAQFAPPGYVIALRWTALAEDDATLAFPMRAARAQDAAGLLEASRAFQSPPQNIVYADSEGKIGFIAAGRVPQRLPDDDLRGLVPAPGWLPEYDWDGFLPFEALPRSEQPALGRIVTANQKLTPPGYAYWMGADWDSPYRAERITALLDARPSHSVESFTQIQADVHSGVADELLEPLLRALPSDLSPEEQAAASALKGWDREMRVGRSEPLVFWAWLRELGRQVYADELDELFAQNWAVRSGFLKLVLEDRGDRARWCDNRHTPEPESCSVVVRAALRESLAYLSRRFGDDPSTWTWGRAHRAVARHASFGSVPILSSWFNVSAEAPGDTSTVNLASYSLRDDDTAFTSGAGPGFRAVYDLGDPQSSLAIVNTGQSGNVLSPYYRDMNPLWVSGRYVPLITDRARIEQGALGTLVLRPRDASVAKTAFPEPAPPPGSEAK
jgi:penicillin amidase